MDEGHWIRRGEPMNRLAIEGPDLASLVRLLQPLQAIAVAVLDEDGRVLEANRGFRRLVADEGEAAMPDAGSFLMLPTFSSVRDADAQTPEGTLYRGRITVNRPGGAGSTLVGEIRRCGGGFLLIAEHEVEQLEATTTSMIELNERMADTQRELVRAKKAIEARERELAKLAATDPLTGLANRREFDRRLGEEITRARRTESPLTAVLIDLDGFKEFNDTHGHVHGDACLMTVARLLAERVRPYDIVARYGGEEFAVVLIGTGAEDARVRAEAMRAAIARTPIPGGPGRITGCFGVAEFQDGEPDELLRAADDALYAAKRAGRNRVEVAER